MEKIDEVFEFYNAGAEKGRLERGLGKVELYRTKEIKYVMDEFPIIEKIQLEVATGNQKGISFYAKNGFVVVTSKDEEIDNEHIELIVMEKYI